MPWRGPEIEGEFPSLGHDVADWIEANCAIPDGDHAGEPFVCTDEQLRYLLWHYRLRPKAKKSGKPSRAFEYRRSHLRRPQKWGKGPLGSAMICAEGAPDGPVLFDGWDADGEPVGKPWPTPWIQVMALAEDQTDNVWTALVPMIELGALKADIPDTGITRINVPGGRIEPVTTSAGTRLGQRITFYLLDEPHLLNTHNGGVRVSDVIRRNAAGMGGRGIETSNAYDPSEDSVAQQTAEAVESGIKGIYVDLGAAPKGSIRNKRDRRRMLKEAYGDSWWIDLERLEEEIAELLPRDPNQAERYYLNRVVAGADKAFDLELFKGLGEDKGIEPGRKVTLGFDGSRRRDSTGVVATDVETGHQVVVAAWERPPSVHEDHWEVPVAEVNAAIADAFDTWDVWRLYADPPYWETQVDEWAGKYGEERVIAWWTNRLKAVAYSLKAYVGALVARELTHDGSDVLQRHVGNAVKHKTKIRDPDTEEFMWVIRKETPKSPRKIDVAMASLLSWEARGDAIKSGELDKPSYKIAAW